MHSAEKLPNLVLMSLAAPVTARPSFIDKNRPTEFDFAAELCDLRAALWSAAHNSWDEETRIRAGAALERLDEWIVSPERRQQTTARVKAETGQTLHDLMQGAMPAKWKHA